VQVSISYIGYNLYLIEIKVTCSPGWTLRNREFRGKSSLFFITQYKDTPKSTPALGWLRSDVSRHL